MGWDRLPLQGLKQGGVPIVVCVGAVRLRSRSPEDGRPRGGGSRRVAPKTLTAGQHLPRPVRMVRSLRSAPNPLPISFCERLGINAHTSPSRPRISSLGEPIYCPGLQVRMLPAVCNPPGAGALLSYTRSTSAACNPFGPVFTSKLTFAPSSNDRYPSPIIAEKWTNTSSPLSRWMNP